MEDNHSDQARKAQVTTGSSASSSASTAPQAKVITAPPHTNASALHAEETVHTRARSLIAPPEGGWLNAFMLKATGWMDKPAAWIEQAIAKSKNLPQTNFDLGVKFEQEGRYRDAIRRYKFVRWLDNNFQGLDYHFGVCYAGLDEKDIALAYFLTAAQSNPNNPLLWFMVATINIAKVPPEHLPATMPREMAEPFFNRWALNYDESGLRDNYKGHVVISEWLNKFLDPARLDYELLDLGCGTGLVGHMMHGNMARIIGIDISEMMGLIASERKSEGGSRFYDDVMHTEIRAYMAQVTTPFCDVVTMVRSPAYVGEMASIIDNCAKAIRAGGFFGCVFEPYSYDSGYGLVQKTARFGHSEAYMREACEAAGLEIRALESAPITAGLEGRILIAQKPQ